MQIHRLLSVLLACAIAAAAHGATAAPVAQTIVENVGGVDVVLPVPPGFVLPGATPPAMRDMMIHALPPTNRLVTVMLTQQFLDELHPGGTAGKTRYLAVQSFRSVEQSGATPELFDQVKAMFRNQSAQLLASARSQADESTGRISQDIGKLTGDSKASVQASDQQLLGIFDEQADSISLGAVQSLSTAVHDKKLQMKQAMAMTAVLLHGQVLMAAFYSSDDSQADIDWVEDQARAWNKRLHQLNP